MKNNTHYELTFIVDGNIPENEHNAVVKTVKDLLATGNATIISEIELGRKKLSYPIKKSQKGNYFSIEFEVEPTFLKPLEIKLKLEKAILRFLMIKKPKNVINKPFEEKEEVEEKEEKPRKNFTERKAAEAKKPETISVKAPVEEKKEEIIKEEIIEEAPIEEVEEVKPTKAKEAKKEEPETSTKDELDEKLDEILNKQSF